jgi:hypothetical protein
MSSLDWGRDSARPSKQFTNSEHHDEQEHERATRAPHICSIMLSPNCEHLISVAPSIKRAKS